MDDKELLAYRLDHITSVLETHCKEATTTFKEIRESLDGCDEYPGVRGRLDRLEQTDKARVRHFAYIWSVLLTSLGAFLGWIGLGK